MTYDKGRYVFEVGSSSKDIRGTVTATMTASELTPELKTVVADCRVSVLRVGEEAQISYTACLNNDSFLNVKDTQVSYRTNNAAVVTVGADGKLKAVGQGVATVYADVTWNGKTVTSSFSVKVMPDLSLATLKVAGKAYKTGANQFSVIRKASAKAPAVTATAKDPALRVVIEQAAAVPGTAVVSVIDDVTADKAVYLVNFGPKAVSDEFKSAPASAWAVLGENKADWKVESGALAITTAAGDLTLANNNAANVFVQSANTDWTIDTKLTCSDTPGMPAQNAGIIAYQDNDNFVKLVYSAQMFRRGRQGSGASIQLTSEENGFAKTTVNTNTEGVENNVVWLRLQKSGDVYTAFYSADGKKFVEAGKLEIGLKDIQAGVIACDGALPAAFNGFRRGAMPQADPKPMTASFDYFRISSK